MPSTTLYPEKSAFQLSLAILGVLAIVLLMTPTPAASGLVILNLGLPLMISAIRKDWKLAGLFLGAILLRESLSFYNYYIALLPGAEWDSLTFETIGCQLAEGAPFEWQLGSGAFHLFISFWYQLFGCSGFLTAQLSIAAMTGFGITILKIIRLLSWARFRYLILFLVLYLPSHLMFSSLNLREPFQCWFLANAVLALFQWKFIQPRPIKRSLLLFLLNTALLAITHNGLLFYAIGILLPLGLGFCLSTLKPLYRTLVLTFIALLLIPILVFFSTHALHGSQLLHQVLSGKMVEYINDYRTHLAVGRTQYQAEFDASSITALFISTLKILWHYWFEPFPSRIEGLSDVLVWAEIQVYIVLLIGTLITLWRNRACSWSLKAFWLVLYLSLSLLWAAGTGNFGTSIRHQMTASWILILLGIPGFHSLWQDLKSRRKPQ